MTPHTHTHHNPSPTGSWARRHPDTSESEDTQITLSPLPGVKTYATHRNPRFKFLPTRVLCFSHVRPGGLGIHRDVSFGSDWMSGLSHSQGIIFRPRPCARYGLSSRLVADRGAALLATLPKPAQVCPALTGLRLGPSAKAVLLHDPQTLLGPLLPGVGS